MRNLNIIECAQVAGGKDAPITELQFLGGMMGGMAGYFFINNIVDELVMLFAINIGLCAILAMSTICGACILPAVCNEIENALSEIKW